MNKRISFLVICCLFSANAHAVDYATDNWRFALNADGMAGFLETKDDKPLGIYDWDVKTSATYKINNHYRIGAVYSIDADAVDSDEYVHDAFCRIWSYSLNCAQNGTGTAGCWIFKNK